MSTSTRIHHGDGRWTEFARCLGGWRRVERWPPEDERGLEWVQSHFHPSEDAEALAAALGEE